ncbi:phage holin family protein [Acidothermaceae bacterium B102]|nr:phage holin family protein [Acidothermaceae bacterium B102]
MGAEGHLRHRMRLSGRHTRAWRPSGPRGWALLRSLATSYIALGTTLYILPGRQSSGPLAVLGLAVAVAVVGVVLRPVLAGLAVVLGSFGLLLLGVVYQAIVLDVAIAFAPALDFNGRAEILLVSWIAAAVAAVVNWVLDSGSEDVFLSQLLGRAVRVSAQGRHPYPGAGSRTGLLVIQLDGVGEEVVRQALTSGSMPTLSGWLRERSHVLRGWHTGLPATTPAGQAVILHGDVTEVPSFRWYEKESGRVLVANHPRDAAEVERRISTGHGLLADGGVSVSNLFSGDAPQRLLTMSDARLPPRRTDGVAWFATARGGLVRSLAVSAGQVVTELYQGRRQRRRDVQPRVHRGLVFAVQRAVTTALLSDLTVAIVAEQVARGAPVIYVDLIDYDEVAHHAGPSRPESMRTLEELDRLVRLFDDVVRETGQPYEIVVLSDHGQSQGATFAQLAGEMLHTVVAELIDGDPADSTSPLAGEAAPAERWGSANVLLTGLARSTGLAGRVTRSRSVEKLPAEEMEVTLGGKDKGVAAAPSSNLVEVVAAGSLAHIYLTDVPGRATLEDVEARYPRLVSGLAKHPHVGAVLARAVSGELVVHGAAGWRVVTAEGTGGGEGDDPLAAFGPGAAADLVQLDQRRHVGDLVLLGGFDPASGEVAAFEELVGSHGGLGGAQTEAMLIHPADWVVPGGTLHGLELHALLLGHLP